MADDASTVEPSPARQRQWWLLLPAVLVAAVGAKLYFDLSQLPEANAGVTLTAAPELAASAPASAAPSASGTADGLWGQPSLAAERVGRAASAALATARAAAGLTPQPPAEVVMDLCGVGRLTVPRPELMGPEPQNATNFEILPAPLGLWARAEAWPRVLAAMENAGQPERTRAAALVLRAAGLEQSAATPDPAMFEAAQRKLAKLARRSTDPLVLQWALAVCSRKGAPHADCNRLSPRDLTRLAPDEARHWLEVAALPGIKAAEQAAALDKAAEASRWDDAQFRLPQALDSAWPADLPEYLRSEMLSEAIGAEIALPDTAGFAALRVCSAQALQAPTTQAACERLARQLQQRGRTLFDQGLAVSLGARLGWPETELQALKSENAALTESATLVMATDQPYACKAVEEVRQYIGSVANEGELQTLRSRLASVPTTPRPATNKQ